LKVAIPAGLCSANTFNGAWRAFVIGGFEK